MRHVCVGNPFRSGTGLMPPDWRCHPRLLRSIAIYRDAVRWAYGSRSVCGRVRVCKRACVVCVVSVPCVITWYKVRGLCAMFKWTRAIECAPVCVVHPLRLGLTRESAARRDGSGLTRGVCRRMSPLRLGCTIGGPTRVGRVTLFRDWAHRLGPCRIRPATSTSRTRVE